MSAIEIKDISKKFKEKGKEFYALKNINLNIEKGEIFGLLGPNGAGKTTLLNIMIRMLIPETGTVSILGEIVDKNPKILEQMNYVSGETRFHWVLRSRDILDFYAASYNLSSPVRKERIDELLDFFDIKHVQYRKFHSLSTGEKMRLIFAKAMLNKPKVLLLDEPTLGLDPVIAISVRNEILRLKKEFGTTILLTSHYMNEVEQLSDRIAFIYNGEIVDIGDVEKVKLKMFDGYDVYVHVKRIMNRDFLKENKFNVKGKVLQRKLMYNENISNMLSLLHEKGYEILDIETKKPTLEDYFVKILKREKT